MKKAIIWKPCAGCGYSKPAGDQCYRRECAGDEIPASVVFSAVILVTCLVAMAFGVVTLWP